jgi:hypothetical protein
MPSDLTTFDLAHAEQCGRVMAAAMADAATMEAAAHAACGHLRADLTDDAGRPASILVRCYKTHTYGALPPDIQRIAKRAYGTMAFSPPQPDLKCLVLLATVGDEPGWNDRRASKNHQAIPLPSKEIVERAPMIAQLIRELGIDVSEIIQPTRGVVRELAGKSYGVFHVAEATGSRYIPAQDFVQQHDVRSVVGFGGTLPDGEMIAMIVFSRVPIGIDVADRFRTMARDLHDGLARFAPDSVFVNS